MEAMMQLMLSALAAITLILPAVSGRVAADNEKQPPAEPEAKVERENYIGVFTQPVWGALAVQLSEVLSKGEGLLVNRVLPGSPAEEAGLQRFDILTTYDEQKLVNPAQLKKLVVEDKTDRTVRLGIVRTATQQSVDVVLGQRDVPSVPRRSIVGQVRFPRQVAVLSGNAMVIGRGGLAVSPVIRLPARRPVQKAAKSHHLSISVTTPDNKQYKVQVSYRDAKGESHKAEFNGSLEDVRKRLDKLPDDVRDDVRGSLDRIGTEQKRGSAFRFQLQPRIEGRTRKLRIIISRPRKNGGTRVFELDHTFDGPQAIDVNELLEIDEFADELKLLSPAVRSQIETTLRRIRVPRIRLQVLRSQ